MTDPIASIVDSCAWLREHRPHVSSQVHQGFDAVVGSIEHFAHKLGWLMVADLVVIIDEGQHDPDTGQPLFWSNADGWTDIGGATVFFTTEGLKMPSGWAVKAKNLGEAIDDLAESVRGADAVSDDDVSAAMATALENLQPYMMKQEVQNEPGPQYTHYHACKAARAALAAYKAKRR